jgi:hypothetical protein
VGQIVVNHRSRPLLILPVPALAPCAEPPGNSLPLEILKVLRDAGKPLTGLLVYEALRDRGIPTGQSTLNRLLAKMVSDGDLVNPQGAKPPGYRLPADQ